MHYAREFAAGINCQHYTMCHGAGANDKIKSREKSVVVFNSFCCSNLHHDKHVTKQSANISIAPNIA